MKKRRPHHEGWWALVIQGVSLIVLAPIAWGVKDGFVAGSLLLGGLACLIPNLYLYRRLFKYFGAQNAHKMVKSLYWGEMVKLFLTAGIFAALGIGVKNNYLTFVRPLYLFVGYFYAQLVFWVAPFFWGYYRRRKRSALNDYD